MDNKDLIVTEFDLRTTQGSTQMIKALIPLLSPSEQKIISIMVRIWELIQTVRFFQREVFTLQEYYSSKDSMSPSGSEREAAIRPDGIDLDMLKHIKKYCSQENQQMIDMVLNFMNISEIMKMSNLWDEKGGGLGGLVGGPGSLFGSGGTNGDGDHSGNSGADFAAQFANMMNLFRTADAVLPNGNNQTGSENNPAKTESGPECESDNISHFGGLSPESLMRSMMSGEQKQLYDDFIKELNETES
ncbi:MAG: hypothetical protein ACI4AQ_05700 [Lachnospiraceae bacterium]